MRLSNPLRTLASRGAYAALFLCSFWVPYQYGPALAPRNESPRSVAPPTSERCGLAIAPLPRSTAAEPIAEVAWTTAIPERVMLRLDVPLPPLARNWEAPAAPAAETTPAAVEVLLAAAPAREEKATIEPLPALDFGPRPTQPAPASEAAAGQWRRPLSLLALLNRLNEFPPAASWAARVIPDVERLTSPEQLSKPQRAALVEQLRVAVAEVEPILETLDAPQGSTLVRRAGYGLSRRLDLWQAASAVDRRESQGELPAPAPESLAQCMADVNQLMQGAAGDDWRAYLLLESLNELSRARPVALSSDDRSLARRVLQRLDYARRLPEQQQFVSQGPLAALEAQLRHWAVEPINTTALLARLEQYEESGHASLGAAVGEDLRRLAFSPHAEHQALARTVEEHYRNCNLRLAVSRDLLSRFLPPQEPIEAPVRDVILGLPVRGRSTTTNELSLKLLPSNQRLRLEISAKGLVQSTTTSQRNSVSFNSRSESTYTARKVLEFGARRIDGEPAVAEADTNSRLRSVQSQYDDVPLIGSIVQDVAMDRYRERRDAARREVQGKVAAQARQKLDELAAEGFRDAHQRFIDQVMAPLDRMSLAPSYSEAHTDEKRFTLRTRLATQQHLSANTPRPRALSDSLLSAQVHESAANNILDRMGLAGRRFTADELRRHLAQQLNQKKPLEPSSADDYTVTFAETDAARMRFHEGRVELAVSIALLESGSRSWQNFTVYANYKPEAVDRGVELVRDGVIGLDGERLGMQSQFVLRGVFGRIFSEERRIAWLSDLLRQDQRLTGLQVTQCVIEDGWIGLSIGPQRANGPLALVR